MLNGLNVGDAFFNRLGASISERTFCASGALTGYIMTVGPTPGTDPESLVHSSYIIIWACNVISTNLHLWPIIAEAKRRGAKVVVIDPRRTRTAEQADWHIPIRPGTDGALALGMINVIVSENLIDRDYVEKYTVGYPELKARAHENTHLSGFRRYYRYLLRGYRETGARICSDATLGDSLRRRDRAPGRRWSVRAGDRLHACAGGGLASGGQGPGLHADLRFSGETRGADASDFVKPGTRHINQYQLGAALSGELGLAPPVKALFVYNSNPVVVAPDQDRIVAGLARDDLFTVVSEQFLTDTTADFADIVLPTDSGRQFDLIAS